MILKCALFLFAVAVVFEFFGPVVLQKLFPQALVAPAPEATERPKRAAARDAIVDDAMEDLNNPSNPLSPHATLTTAALSSTSDASASSVEAMLLTGVDPQFDFDDFRTAERDKGAVKPADQVAHAQQVEVIQGIPDIFVDDEASQHA